MQNFNNISDIFLADNNEKMSHLKQELQDEIAKLKRLKVEDGKEDYFWWDKLPSKEELPLLSHVRNEFVKLQNRLGETVLKGIVREYVHGPYIDKAGTLNNEAAVGVAVGLGAHQIQSDELVSYEMRPRFTPTNIINFYWGCQILMSDLFPSANDVGSVREGRTLNQRIVSILNTASPLFLLQTINKNAGGYLSEREVFEVALRSFQTSIYFLDECTKVKKTAIRIQEQEDSRPIGEFRKDANGEPIKQKYVDSAEDNVYLKCEAIVNAPGLLKRVEENYQTFVVDGRLGELL